MPNTSKKMIAEQVCFRLYGGYPDTAAPVQYEDVYKAAEQKANALFKLKQFDTTLPSGETIPENTMIATYEDVAVTTFGVGKSKSTLPVTPISLPKNAGIFLVYDPERPDNPFIPVQRGQGAILKADTLLNDLMGLVWYEPKNNVLIYSKDLTMLGVSSVTMELCVLDFSEYGETDILPIPSDMEERLVTELYEMFSGVTPENGIVNNITTAEQKTE